MTDAVIGAIGVIVVALIGVTNSRLEANDKRTRLLKDVEILEKLDESSAEHAALKKSVGSDVESMLRSDKLRSGFVPVRSSLLWSLGFFWTSALLATALDKYNVGNKRGDLELAVTALRLCGYLATAFAVLFVLIATIPACVSVVRSVWRHA